MLKLDEKFVPHPTVKVRISTKCCQNNIDSHRQPSGKESLVERWILNKLNTAAAETNRELAARNFMNATTAVYNFWLYELCDVYIVGQISLNRNALINAVVRSTGSDEANDR